MKVKRPMNLATCIDLFRGTLHFEGGKEVATSKGVLFDAQFSAHGRRVHVHRRTDGLLFVNAAGRTAIVSSKMDDSLKREVAAALRR